MKKSSFKIPWLPISALIFYISVVILWSLNLIPSPLEIVNSLESLYNTYGLYGLFIASFLEGIVYLGLYMPGSFIVAITVFSSDGTFESLLYISLVVAFALTITSFINYFFGKYFLSKKNIEPEIKKYKTISKNLFLSMIHPNILAFYFFNAGFKKDTLFKIIAVPVIMIPYGFLLANILYTFKPILKKAVQSPYVMITYLLIWLFITILVRLRKT